jgi:cytochrome b subunit of formate dehydrogenase
MMTQRCRQLGQTTLIVLLFSAVAIIVLSGFVVWASYNLNAVFRDADQSQSFMSAEAGIEYYRWHLAHAQQDYQDGTGHAGPYLWSDRPS